MCKEEKHFEIVELDSSKMYTKRNHFTLAQRTSPRDFEVFSETSIKSEPMSEDSK